MKKISKKELEREIEGFFSEIRYQDAGGVKKIRNLAMNSKINLGEKRRLFCKKCLVPYSGGEKIRIKNRIKSIRCINCGYIARRKIKPS